MVLVDNLSMQNLFKLTVVALLSLSSLGLISSQAYAEAKHPRLFLDAEDIPALRERAKQEPYKSIVQALRQELPRAQKELERDLKVRSDRAVMYDMTPRVNAALYLVTGDIRYADAAKKSCLKIVEHSWFDDRRSKGLTRGAAAVTVAIAYDLCYDAWDEDTRKLMSDKLYAVSRSMGVSMGRGANNSLANNWAAVRYAGLGLAGLASDHEKGMEQAKWAYPNLVRHLDANLGDNGWNPEGVGYTNYPWQFTGPFGYAAHRAGIGDLREDVGKKLQMTLWHTMVQTVAIKANESSIGQRPDLADDHHRWGGGPAAAFAFFYSPDDLVPAVKWQYDRLCGLQGDKTFGSGWGGPFYALLLYPEDVEAKNPQEVQGLHFVDKSQGAVVFRNRFQDENDLVVLTNAKARPSRGGHSGPDANTFRIVGLDNLWVVGSGRTYNVGGQTNLFPDPIPGRGKGDLGKLLDLKLDEKTGGGYVKMSGSPTGVENHVRQFMVDYDNPAAEAVIITHETSDNGKHWRLNTVEFNQITTQGNQFMIAGPNGNKLVGTVLTPKNPEFKTGTFERGGVNMYTPVVYKGKDYKDNHWVQFEVDGQATVVITLVRKGQAVPGVKDAGDGMILVGDVQYEVSDAGVAQSDK